MIKRKKTYLWCLLWVSCICNSYGQSQGLTIDFRADNGSLEKEKTSKPNSQINAIHDALKRSQQLTFINGEGKRSGFLFEEIAITENTRIKLIADQETTASNLSADKVQYYTSKNSELIQDEIFLSVRKNAIKGTWVEGEDVIDFDIGKRKVESLIVIKNDELYKSERDRCSVNIQESLLQKAKSLKSNNEEKSIEIGVVLDYSYVSTAGGLQGAVDKVVSVLSAASVDFKFDFNSELNFEIRDIVLSNCESCDPWTSSNNITTVQEDVREWILGNEELRSNDVVLFWSDRDFEDDVLGSAQTNSICTEFNTVVLKDKSEVLWELRVIASHEIAHTLGGTHDSNFSNTIMHASLVNSSQWSAASIQSINNGISNASCLQNITEPCVDISEVEVEVLSTSEIRVSFESGISDSVSVLVTNLSTGGIGSVRILYPNVQSVVAEYSPCQDYNIRITPYCNGKKGMGQEVIWSSRKEDSFVIIGIEPTSCRAESNQSFYDLTLSISSPFTRSVIVNYKGLDYSLIIHEGQHTYVIPEIQTTEQENVILAFMDSSTGAKGCLGINYIDEPSLDCAFQYVESFDNCDLPLGWSIYKSTGNNHEDFKWKFGGTTRSIQNYGNAGNAQSTKTIDGTCMAIIDDDLINLSNHSGIAYLESPAFNIAQYDSVFLSFDLIFDEFVEKGVNTNSYLMIEVSNNDEWHELKRISENPCPWYSIWNATCVQSVVLDLSDYRNDEMLIRWQYNDGSQGNWAGMAAIDNVELNGRKENSSPCNQADIYIDDSPMDNIETSGNMLYVSAMIDISEAMFHVTQGAIFMPGAAIGNGVNLNVDLNPCVD